MLKILHCISYNCKNNVSLKRIFPTCWDQRVDFSTKNTNNWRLLFYGTDRFSEVCLKVLNSNRLSTDESRTVKDIDVVCSGADCEVRRCATSLGLKIHSWPFQVPLHLYDIGVVVSFGHLIPTESILACHYGIINAHPSILPRWRGAAPLVHTILNGDIETGVTITQVSPNKFDVGNIIMQEKYVLPPRCTSELLSSELSDMASQMLIKTLKNLPLLIESSYPQPKEGVMYARKVKPQHGHLDWEQNTVLSIDRKFRAYKGHVNIYTYWKGIKIVLLEHVSPEEVLLAKIPTIVPGNVSPGFCYFHKKRKILYVKCQDGWIGITRFKIPNSGEITAQEFYNGFISKVELKNCSFNNSS